MTQDSAASPPALDEGVRKYLEHLRVERRLAQRSLALYEHAFRSLSHHATQAQVPLHKVQSHHARRWMALMHEAGLGPRSLALTLSAWRGLYRWWGRDGLVQSNPIEGLRAPKAAKPLPKALSVDHAMALADHQGQGHPALVARDRCMVELLYGSGLRVGELTGLDTGASSTARGWIELAGESGNETLEGTAHVMGKGSKRRSVPVGGSARRALKAWLGVRAGMAHPDEAALFVSQRGTRLTDSQVRSRLKVLAIQAGLPTHVHPHMLRHSFASHVLQSSGDLRAVQELLGHANITTTQVYTKLDHQHLSKVYDAAHPRAKRMAK
jgi:integrase/recombinase XerC